MLNNPQARKYRKYQKEIIKDLTNTFLITTEPQLIVKGVGGIGAVLILASINFSTIFYQSGTL